MEPLPGGQVAVYVDFDNIVMSRYDELFGRESFRNDSANAVNPRPVVKERLTEARVDISAIVDYASTFGTVVMSRAYADWSRPVPRSYATDTLRRSIDLVQLFPMSGTKNGADIRLAIDVTDDLAQYPNITHVVVIAGDSDYVALAQRCRRRGRTVIGVGAAGSVGKYWAAACNEFRYYKDLVAATVSADPTVENLAGTATADLADAPGHSATEADTLLLRAARLLYLTAASESIPPSSLKNQMKKLDPAFTENSLGHKTFGDFLRSRSHLVDYVANSSGGLVYLRERGSRPPAGASPDAGAVTPPPVKPPAGLTDLGGRPLTTAQPDQLPEWGLIRKSLNLPATAIIGSDGERAIVSCARALWEMTAAGVGAFPAHELDAEMQTRGFTEVTARRARAVLTLCATPVVRDESMLMYPNEELTGLDDAELQDTLRRLLADRIRQRMHPEHVSAAAIAAATHGADAPPAVELAYATGLCSPGLGAMTDAVGAMLLPAPVLWDVAAAFVGAQGPLARLDQFVAGLTEPLGLVERDLETVPMAAAHQSLIAAGLIHAAGDGAIIPETSEEVVEAVLRGWLRHASGSGLVVRADDRVAMDAVYRLVLPDRHQRAWRTWVREIVHAA